MKPKAKSQLKDDVQGEWMLLIMESKSKFVVNYHKLHFSTEEAYAETNRIELCNYFIINKYIL